MKIDPIMIKPEPAVFKISPLGFHKYSAEFLQIAKLAPISSEFSPVTYYLYCHALELILKAYLLVNNMTIKELIKIGHDLDILLKKARGYRINRHVTITQEYSNELNKVNKFYSSKGFEYFRPKLIKFSRRDSEFPNLKIIDQFATQLIEKLESICLNEPNHDCSRQ